MKKIQKYFLPFIFIFAVTLLMCSIECVSAAVPKDAVKYGNSYYKIVLGSYTWQEAKKQCEKEGGHLATITSKEEQNFINTKLNINGNRLWIGGYRADDGKWKWVTGEKFSYTNWGEGEPNNSGAVVSNERYIAVWPVKWNDLANSNVYEQSGFICEWAAPAATPTPTPKPVTPSAKINGKSYSSVQKAVDAVKNGQTIVINKNITTSATITINKPNVSFTIDFNNKKYAYTGKTRAFMVTKGTVSFKNAKLTAKNYGFSVQSGATLTIVNGTYSGYFYNKGKLNIKNGTFDSAGTMTSSKDELIQNYGTLVITKGNFTGTKDSALYNKKKATLNGGTFKSTVMQSNNLYNPTIYNAKSSTMTLKSVNISGNGYALSNQGTATINSGTFKAQQVVIYNDSKMTVNNGSFSTNSTNGYWIVNYGNLVVKKATAYGILYNAESKNPSVKIYGGTFSYPYDCPLWVETGTAYVYGGTFTGQKNVTVYIAKKGTARISGGTFINNSTNYYVLDNCGTAYLTGGTFKCNDNGDTLYSPGYISVGPNVKYTGTIRKTLN